MRKPIVLIIFILSQSIYAFAQIHWMYLPNNNLIKGNLVTDTAYRLEDVYFTDTLTGFAVSLPGRLLKTTDGGINWKRKNDILNEALFRSIEFLDGGRYGIAGSLGFNAQLLRTEDSGETWMDYTLQLTDTTTNATRKNICGIAHYGDNFYAVGSWGSTTARFYKSLDKGATWQTKYMDTGLVNNLVDVIFLSQDTGYISGAKKTASVVLKTTDGGNSWTTVFSDTVFGGRIWKLQALTHQLIVGSIEPLFYPDSVNMIRTADGGNSWTILHAGSIPRTAAIGTQGIGFITPAHGWLGGYYDGIFETVDSGKTWQHLSFGYDLNRMFVLDSNHVFAGGHAVYKYGEGIFTGTAPITASSKMPHKLYPVSPNPATGKIKIEFDLQKTGNLVLEVISLDGRRSYPIVNTFLDAGHYTYHWDGSNMPDGNYMIWMGTNEIPLVQKFTLRK